MGKFVIYYADNGLYYFTLQSDNGENILSSDGYTSKTGCMDGIKSVKSYSKEDDCFVRKTSNTNKYYFNLKDTNGRVLGVSGLYKSSINRDTRIETVKKVGNAATVIDSTTKKLKN